MTNSNDRLDRIEILLERSAVASDESLSWIENLLEANYLQSNERLTRIEQLVESNNRFLESFSADLKQYTQTINNLATRIDGVIATARVIPISTKGVTDKLNSGHLVSVAENVWCHKC